MRCIAITQELNALCRKEEERRKAIKVNEKKQNLSSKTGRLKHHEMLLEKEIKRRQMNAELPGTDFGTSLRVCQQYKSVRG